jgi:uncharacterized protein (TIGR03067 family)
MRPFCLIALAFGLWIAVAAADDKAAKGDQDKIQGTWSVVAGTRNGKAVPEERAKSIQLVFAGNKFTIKTKDQVRDFTFKLYPDKKPKAIDVDMDGAVGEGLYDLDGDDLKIIHGESGDPRPKEFVSKEGSKLTLMVLKRAKP